MGVVIAHEVEERRRRKVVVGTGHVTFQGTGP